MTGPAAPGLDRFVTAQAPVFDVALAELKAGAKRTHWMWFVFPQMLGLGTSDMARRYGVVSLQEARDYLGHPVLGPRLELCVRTVLAVSGRSLHEIFGSPDDMKFVSSMTLFAHADQDGDGVFRQAIDRVCAGRPDARTLALISVV